MGFKSNLDYFRSQSRTGRIVFKQQTDPDSKIDEKGNKVLKQIFFFLTNSPRYFGLNTNILQGLKEEINKNSYRKIKITSIDD